MVATAYSNTEKILFDVQWCPEKSFSQFFNGADNSAQITITTTKTIVMIAAYADEMINFGLFIDMLIDCPPAGRGGNYKPHRANEKPKHSNDARKPQGKSAEPKPLHLLFLKQSNKQYCHCKRDNE